MDEGGISRLKAGEAQPMHNNKPTTPLDEFRRLLGEYGSIADLSRRSGLTRRAIEYKRSGERRVTWWDVHALERLLQIKEERP